MSDGHEDAADYDGASVTEQAIGKQSPGNRAAIGKAGVKSKQLRGERLWFEFSEQELERRADRRKPEYGIKPVRLEQILGHIEHEQRGISEIRETLPRFGGEKHRKSARMTEEISGRRDRHRVDPNRSIIPKVPAPDLLPDMGRRKRSCRRARHLRALGSL